MEDLIHLSTNSSAIVPQLLFFLHYSEVIVQAKASGEARQINRVHSGCAHVTRPHPLKFTAVKENGGDRPIMCIVTPHTWHCYSQSNSKQLFYATRVQRTLATGHGVYAITSTWRAAANQFRNQPVFESFFPHLSRRSADLLWDGVLLCLGNLEHLVSRIQAIRAPFPTQPRSVSTSYRKTSQKNIRSRLFFCVFSEYSDCLPSSKNMHGRVSEDSKLPIDVNLRVSKCLSICALRKTAEQSRVWLAYPCQRQLQ